MKKVKVINNHWYPKLFRIGGITIYPYILTSLPKGTVDYTMLKHEMCHIRQVRRDGICRFYSKYIWELFKGVCKHKSFSKAYYDIPYEREAYDTEGQPLTVEEKKELNIG